MSDPTTEATSSVPGSEPVAPLSAPAAPTVDAPWLTAPLDYVTEEVQAGIVRPGWYCYLKEARGFVAVTSVSFLRSRTGKVAFIDLADGRTLALPATDESVFVRRPAAT